MNSFKSSKADISAFGSLEINHDFHDLKGQKFGIENIILKLRIRIF